MTNLGEDIKLSLINPAILNHHDETSLQANPQHSFPCCGFCREHAPSIIFMDEIDSIGSSRLEGGSGGMSGVAARVSLDPLYLTPCRGDLFDPLYR